MTKKNFIAAIAANANITKRDAEIALDAVVNTIISALAKNESVSLYGFGTFSTVKKEECERRNPRTGEKFISPAHMAPKFKFSSTFKKSFTE